MGQKIDIDEPLTLLPLGDVLERLAREIVTRTNPSLEFPPVWLKKYETSELLKYLIQLTWGEWGRRDYTLYGMDSNRTDVIQDRDEFLDKVLEYEDVDFATISSAVNAIHKFLKKARYAITSRYQGLLKIWRATATFDASADYDLLEAYNVLISEAKKNWLKVADSSVGGYEIRSGFEVFYTGSYLGYTNFRKGSAESKGSLTVAFPYRIGSTWTPNPPESIYCFDPQEAKTYIYKKTVTSVKDDSLGDCIECGIGSLAERTKGVIPFDEEWEDENYPGKKFYGSKVLFPEFEEGLGGNIANSSAKTDMAKEIIANGGTVPGYAG